MEQYSRLRVRLGMIEKVDFEQKMMGYTITHHINKRKKSKYQYFNRENNTKKLYLIGQHIVKSLVSTKRILIVPSCLRVREITRVFATLIHRLPRAVLCVICPLPTDTNNCVCPMILHT